MVLIHAEANRSLVNSLKAVQPAVQAALVSCPHPEQHFLAIGPPADRFPVSEAVFLNVYGIGSRSILSTSRLLPSEVANEVASEVPNEPARRLSSEGRCEKSL